MDPHIFADPDPDPGSQNLADPTDPDPKHWTVGQGTLPKRNWIFLDLSIQKMIFIF